MTDNLEPRNELLLLLESRILIGFGDQELRFICVIYMTFELWKTLLFA
jgi:hypothetical protein